MDNNFPYSNLCKMKDMVNLVSIVQYELIKTSLTILEKLVTNAPISNVHFSKS